MQHNYNTKQKTAIIKILKENKDKLLSADEILDLLINDNAKVGKATLYRFLDNLVLTKELRKSYNSNINKFEYQMICGDCSMHLHMKCKVCGKVVHLDCKETTNYLSHIEGEHNFIIDQYMSTIYGVCKNCMVEE